jgi:hypothetical protein
MLLELPSQVEHLMPLIFLYTRHNPEVILVALPIVAELLDGLLVLFHPIPKFLQLGVLEHKGLHHGHVIGQHQKHLFSEVVNGEGLGIPELAFETPLHAFKGRQVSLQHLELASQMISELLHFAFPMASVDFHHGQIVLH